MALPPEDRNPPAARVRGTVASGVMRASVIGFVLAGLVYVGDFASVRYGIPGGRQVYGSVQIDEYLAVPLKNGKNDYEFVGSETATCTHSLFPQLGFSPCWWLNRHRERRQAI